MVELKPVALDKAYRIFNVGGTALVSAAHEGKTDVMPATWVCPLNIEPSRVTACVDSTHYTRPLIEKSGFFALALPTKAIARETLYLGSVSKNDEPEKLEKSGAKFFTMDGWDIPFVEGCAAYVIYNFWNETQKELAKIPEDSRPEVKCTTLPTFSSEDGSRTHQLKPFVGYKGMAVKSNVSEKKAAAAKAFALFAASEENQALRVTELQQGVTNLNVQKEYAEELAALVGERLASAGRPHSDLAGVYPSVEEALCAYTEAEEPLVAAGTITLAGEVAGLLRDARGRATIG